MTSHFQDTGLSKIGLIGNARNDLRPTLNFNSQKHGVCDDFTLTVAAKVVALVLGSE